MVLTLLPAADQIEITVFGPGYGESIVVHVGNGRWLVFDSCQQETTGRPVALHYFDQIGVMPSEQVDLVLISHWHDDHIRGASQLVERCVSADICISSAFTKEEFLKYLSINFKYNHHLTVLVPMNSNLCLPLSSEISGKRTWEDKINVSRSMKSPISGMTPVAKFGPFPLLIFKWRKACAVIDR